METLIVHAGQNSIDKCVSGQEAATQLKENLNLIVLLYAKLIC